MSDRSPVDVDLSCTAHVDTSQHPWRSEASDQPPIPYLVAFSRSRLRELGENLAQKGTTEREKSVDLASAT